MKNGIIIDVCKSKNHDFPHFSGGSRLGPPGTPSIVPRGGPPKIVSFSPPIKNETGTKLSFYKKVATKEKTMSPPTPPSGL